MTASKRIFDMALALLLAGLLALPFGILLVAHVIMMGLPVLHVGERMTSPQHAFRLYKLRSMRLAPDDHGVAGGHTSNRIPAWGRFLRASHLDEVPQLWNILRGDMTFVGPRPPLRIYVERFPHLYARVLRSRPGLTGLATLRLHGWEARLLAACASAVQTDAVYAGRCIPRKARLDLVYQRHGTLKLDAVILLSTVRSVWCAALGKTGTPMRAIPKGTRMHAVPEKGAVSSARASRRTSVGQRLMPLMLRALATRLQCLRDADKRVILALADAALGAAIMASLNGWSGALASGAGVIGIAAFCLGLLSAAAGLNRIKLNSFVHSGVPRALMVAILFGCTVGAVCGTLGAASALTIASRAAILAFGGIVLSRTLTLHLTLWLLGFRHSPMRVLVYGAGKTGQQLVAALRTHDSIVPIGFVDDNPALHGASPSGLRVYPTDNLPALARQLRVGRVLLAMPSQSAAKLMRLSCRIHAAGLDVHALPSFAQLVGAEALCDQLAPFDPDLALGRTERAWDLDSRADAYRGRSVMVTGAGGSVGTALCHQLLTLRPGRLVLYEMSELALYTIHRALSALPLAQGVEIVPVLGSVTEALMVRSALQGHDVEVVFHAAAYKHVPLVELNPIAGLSNNVLGTQVLAEAALEFGIERFILISSDKAVRPTNVMGASKRLAELVVQDLAKRSRRTVFSLVRFGNVIGSSGSVMPLFRDQIAAGGPVTLTHEDVTRYFMTLSEAAQLVLHAGSLDESRTCGGDAVYVLDMGEPIKIRDLAGQMVVAAGLTVRDSASPDGDIEIRIVGLRPGEKLHEELLISQGMVTTAHPKILRAVEPSLSAPELAGAMQALRRAISVGDADHARLVVEAATSLRDGRLAGDEPGENSATRHRSASVAHLAMRRQ